MPERILRPFQYVSTGVTTIRTTVTGLMLERYETGYRPAGVLQRFGLRRLAMAIVDRFFRFLDRKHKFTELFKVSFLENSGQEFSNLSIYRDALDGNSLKLIFLYTRDEANRYHTMNEGSLRILISDMETLLQAYEELRKQKSNAE